MYLSHTSAKNRSAASFVNFEGIRFIWAIGLSNAVDRNIFTRFPWDKAAKAINVPWKIYIINCYIHIHNN